MIFDDWLKTGIQNNWISPPVCHTHDGLPTSHHEDQQFEEGDDPCIHILRLYEDSIHKLLVEDNHPPAIWRNPYRKTK